MELTGGVGFAVLTPQYWSLTDRQTAYTVHSSVKCS